MKLYGKNNKRGFSGLSDLISDVDAIPFGENQKTSPQASPSENVCCKIEREKADQGNAKYTRNKLVFINENEQDVPLFVRSRIK
ncbi:MAG: hypothetical protein VB107_05430 [Aminivibrio sp.]|uniref:hypothetical protein n=1 Tax=Aminivibrio sp. TaxID=1872489 RepID=UPI002B1E9C5F|nr:hypothetical protein [Aminivibrio sp.]MEA4952092.1 hypothetical protein [Aminivibrio sp.]